MEWSFVLQYQTTSPFLTRSLGIATQRQFTVARLSELATENINIYIS